MKGYIEDIETITTGNASFRRVLYTAKYCQLVVMSLQPGEEIGAEAHEDGDQFFRVETGEGTAVIDGREQAIHDGDVVIIPAGARHNIINQSATAPLKLYTLYAPPHHRDGVEHKTKAEAEGDGEHFEGVTSEPA